MTDPTDRFVLEIGSGTVAHIIDMDAEGTEESDPFRLSQPAPGEKMCSRGYRDHRFQRVPFSTFVDYHDIEKTGFEGDAPDEICSYCWANAREEVETQQERGDIADQIGRVGYRLRWKQRGRAREEWYDIVVRPETTFEELDTLVCRFTTLDDFHLRMYGLEEEYLESSLNVLPDHQHGDVGDPSYTRASAMTIAEVAERARLWEGDRLSMVYDFGTPSHYYCIVETVHEPDEIDTLLEEADVIAATDTAAIVAEKRP